MSEFRTKGDQARLEDLDGHDNVLTIKPVKSNATQSRVYKVVFDPEATDEQGRNALLESWAVKERHTVLDESKWADMINSEDDSEVAKYVAVD